MKRSAWCFTAVLALISLICLTVVRMTPIIEDSSADAVNRRTPERCRFHLHIHINSKSKELESSLTLDGENLGSLDVNKCDPKLAEVKDANFAVNQGMLQYGIAAGMMVQGANFKQKKYEILQAAALKKLFRGAIMTCAGVTSCVTVADDIASPARRRLLAMSSSDPLTVDGYNLSAGLASCGFILIFLTLLCACHEKKRKEIRAAEEANEEAEDDVTLNKVTLRGSGAAYASPHNGTDFYAVPTTVEERRNGCKEENNGGMGHKRDDSRGSRCATLDRRLPLPPNSIPGIPPVPDDVDPTYDVIPGEKVVMSGMTSPSSIREEDVRTMDSDSQSYEPINRIYAVPEEKKSTEILYEEVNNTRPQSMIEDIMERSSMMEASIHSVHSVQSAHSARLSCFSDSDHGERPRSNMSNRVSVRSLEEHYASPDEARLSSGETTPVADVRHSFPSSLYDEEFPPEPPPVPARRYGEDEIINSGILPEELLAPYVPPVIAAAMFPLLDGEAPARLPTIAPAPIVVTHVTTVPVVQPTGPDYQDPTDPRYIQVTARESLASIRARQAMQRHDYDNFYEPIDGDDPPPPPVRPISPPRERLDMYAQADYDEINYAVPGNGMDNQSDTGLYSDIKDSSVAPPGPPAVPPNLPVPPPPLDPPRVPPLLSPCLMENTSIIYADADSPLPDRRNRAMTVGALPMSAPPAPPSATHRDPVYAVPHKEPRPRARSEINPIEQVPVYAIVDKPRKKDVNENQQDNMNNSLEASASVDFDVTAPLAKYDAEMSFDKSFDKSPSMESSYEGVRVPQFEPEIRTRAHDPPSDRTSVDSGLYQRVDIDEKPRQRNSGERVGRDNHGVKQETRYSNLSEDANYSVIPHQEKCLAKEQMFHMSNHKVPEDFWVRQEHVYQELDEEKKPRRQEIPVTVL